MVLKKLQSNIGASMTIALLLFLLCVTIGSVILAAATAVSGRISGLAESDRRYYAVVSAAELFRDMLDKKELTVTRTSEQSITCTWGEGDTSRQEEPGTIQYGFKVGGAALTNLALSDESLLTKATLDSVLGMDRGAGKEAGALEHLPGKEFLWEPEKTLTVTTSEDETLIVSVTVETDVNGALLFTFENDFTDSPDALTYTLSFTLTPSYSFLADPQSWTDEGEIEATVVQETAGGVPVTDEAGLPVTHTVFRQINTSRVDHSVAVTWTASPIHCKEVRREAL